MTEQRKSVRHRAFLGAHITADAFAGWSAAGTVKNIGAGGARIALSAASLLPDTFRLEIARRAPASARLVWHRDGVVGVSFATRASDRFDIANDDDPGHDERPDPERRHDRVLEARIAAIIGRRETTDID